MKERIIRLLGEDWTRTQNFIRDALKTDIELLNYINGSVLGNPGKQMRPVLSLLMARLCGGGCANERSIHFAAASELLHNATLMHDDVADSSMERRGVPTVMSLLGGPSAVLIGDFWLVKAMEAVLDVDNYENTFSRIFAKTLSDLAEGEMLQLQKASSGDTTEDDYLRIIYNKTASLFEAAMVLGAKSVNASSDMEKAAREYAVNLGLAFQIRDDILDFTPDAELGKPVGQDLEEHKITLPLLGALRNAPEDLAAEIRTMVVGIDGASDGNIDRIRNFVEEYEGVAYAEARLGEFVQKAVSALGIFPDSEEKSILTAMAEFTASRNR